MPRAMAKQQRKSNESIAKLDEIAQNFFPLLEAEATRVGFFRAPHLIIIKMFFFSAERANFLCKREKNVRKKKRIFDEMSMGSWEER
jgi:hypothetical protein